MNITITDQHYFHILVYPMISQFANDLMVISWDIPMILGEISHDAMVYIFKW